VGPGAERARAWCGCKNKQQECKRHMGIPRGGESLLLLLELEVSSGDVRLCVVEDVLED